MNKYCSKLKNNLDFLKRLTALPFKGFRRHDKYRNNVIIIVTFISYGIVGLEYRWNLSRRYVSSSPLIVYIISRTRS